MLGVRVSLLVAPGRQDHCLMSKFSRLGDLHDQREISTLSEHLTSRGLLERM
jgi:hypothetical protein